MAIDQTGNLWRQQCVGQHERGRHRSGQGVAAVQLREHGDDTDAGHGQRQAGQQTSQGKAKGAA